MADITQVLFLHHLRSGPTSWVRHGPREGVGLAFWFRPRTAVLSEVPVDDRELSLVCHARTADHAELSVPVGITHRVSEPGRPCSASSPSSRCSRCWLGPHWTQRSRPARIRCSRPSPTVS